VHENNDTAHSRDHDDDDVYERASQPAGVEPDYNMAARAWPGVAEEDGEGDGNNNNSGEEGRGNEIDDDDDDEEDGDGVPSVYNETVTTDAGSTKDVDVRFLKARDQVAMAAARGSAIFWAERAATQQRTEPNLNAEPLGTSGSARLSQGSVSDFEDEDHDDTDGNITNDDDNVYDNNVNDDDIDDDGNKSGSGDDDHDDDDDEDQLAPTVCDDAWIVVDNDPNH